MKEAFVQVSLLRARRQVKAAITVAEGAKAARREAVKKHALETFGSKQKTEHWLQRVNPLLGNRTPLDVLETDPEQVEAALVQIDHGVYV